ncbi:hypothetical protein CH294_12055 [Rhodococcus sp. 14-2483-1-1]|nr:hypothetical protein CH294_12055 [Rhodococcus sp. 14-2483-1-1]
MGANDAALDNVASWYTTPELRQWMGSGFNFDTYRQKIGTIGERHDPGPYLRCATLAWVGFDPDNRPVSFIGGDLNIWKAGSQFNDMTPDIDGPRTLGFFYAVAATDRHLGYGRRTVSAVIDSLENIDGEAIECSVATDNGASLNLLRSLSELREQRLLASDRILFRYTTHRYGIESRQQG